MTDNLAKQSSGVTKTEPLSSLDLVLAECLEQMILLYSVELLPGQVRLWKSSFEGERPEMIEWAFGEYFKGNGGDKSGKFPPKPADITQIIRQKRESMIVDSYVPVSQTEREMAEAWRKTPEFQEFVKASAEKIEKAFGDSEAKRDVLKKQIRQIVEDRGGR